jgi:hypothetical protein
MNSDRALQLIIPDLVVDGRFICTSVGGAGAGLLSGTTTLVDVKTKSCDDKYTEAASVKVGSAVNKRQRDVNRDYHNRVRKLDEDLETPEGEEGPFTKELKQHGRDSGRVVAPVVGAFGEMSSDAYAIADLVASLLAAEHSSFFNEKASEAKGMFLQRIYRSWGLTAHLGWARLLLDRSRDLVQLPESRGPGEVSSWNTEEAEELENENYQNPDTCCHAARR